MKFRPVAGGCGSIRRRGLYVRESESDRASSGRGGVCSSEAPRVGNGVLMETPGTGL